IRSDGERVAPRFNPTFRIAPMSFRAERDVGQRGSILAFGAENLHIASRERLCDTRLLSRRQRITSSQRSSNRISFLASAQDQGNRRRATRPTPRNRLARLAQLEIRLVVGNNNNALL